MFFSFIGNLASFIGNNVNSATWWWVFDEPDAIELVEK